MTAPNPVTLPVVVLSCSSTFLVGVTAAAAAAGVPVPWRALLCIWLALVVFCAWLLLLTTRRQAEWESAERAAARAHALELVRLRAYQSLGQGESLAGPAVAGSGAGRLRQSSQFGPGPPERARRRHLPFRS